MWTDTAAIVFACTTANHLGLTAAAERVIGRPLPVANCPKCLTFWCTLAYGLSGDGFAANPSAVVRLLAVSFLCAYAAVWLELLEGYTDTLYDRIYEQIYPTADTPDADAADTGGTVPDVQ
jgi:hypothetical protein